MGGVWGDDSWWSRFLLDLSTVIARFALLGDLGDARVENALFKKV